MAAEKFAARAGDSNGDLLYFQAQPEGLHHVDITT